MTVQPPSSARPLSELASTLDGCLQKQDSRRVPLEVLRKETFAAHPELHGDVDTRIRLRNALQELVAAGTVRLPVPGSKTGWDNSMFPALPTWVVKGAVPAGSAPQRVRRLVYPAWLEAAAAVATRDDEFEFLNRIADWRRGRTTLPMVPLEERSLELFGDEKALAQRSASRLFTSGALTLEMLGCHRTPVPFPSRYIPGTGPTGLLVCENSAAYYSMIKAALGLQPENRPDLHIAFGSGNQFSVGHTEIAFLDPSPTRALYCGDLDIAGIRIAIRAAGAMADSLPLVPAAAHYRWMLEQGSRQPDSSGKGFPDAAGALGWFPAVLRPRVQELLASGMRISQETVGLEALTAHPDLVQAL